MLTRLSDTITLSKSSIGSSGPVASQTYYQPKNMSKG